MDSVWPSALADRGRSITPDGPPGRLRLHGSFGSECENGVETVWTANGKVCERPWGSGRPWSSRSKGCLYTWI